MVGGRLGFLLDWPPGFNRPGQVMARVSLMDPNKFFLCCMWFLLTVVPMPGLLPLSQCFPTCLSQAPEDELIVHCTRLPKHQFCGVWIHSLYFEVHRYFECAFPNSMCLPASYLENHCFELELLTLTAHRGHRKCSTVPGRLWGPIWEVPQEMLSTVGLHLSPGLSGTRADAVIMWQHWLVRGSLFCERILHTCVWILDDGKKLNLKHYHKNLAAPLPKNVRESSSIWETLS